MGPGGQDDLSATERTYLAVRESPAAAAAVAVTGGAGYGAVRAHRHPATAASRLRPGGGRSAAGTRRSARPDGDGNEP